MLEIKFQLRNATKTCYRFEYKDGNDTMTLYLKKKQVDDAKINPESGISVIIKEQEE